MIQRLLVANRGEIAVRVIRACRELGIETVAVYSDADRRALHVQHADRAERIGPPPALESYLDQAAILGAALRGGADAIHPGYGFLSENAEFAERCRAAGLTFVGPSAEAIRLMGDKAAAKRLAREASVPVAPGYDGEDQSDARLTAEARAIGPPLLIKPVGGGGGKGMHAIHDLSQLSEGLAAARREARAAFGDDRLMLERLLEHPRHVEIQVAADAFGSIVAIGERECSIQRRHQKVIEESPSPVVDQALRARMSDMAVAIARAANYTNLGTVEFLLDSDGSVYFLEMNTRLQVEHAVTEAVYGLDLVRRQLELAQGRPLTVHEQDLHPRGHAIECRIYAEDPEHGYLPSTGKLLRFRPPDGPGIRNDAGTFAGDVVTPYYDPLLAKLTVHAENRPAALARMRIALLDYAVLGVTTNLSLLRDVIVHPAFAEGDVDTGFLDREFAAPPSAVLPEPVLFAATAARLLARGRDYVRGPTSAMLHPWRAAGQAMPFRWTDGNAARTVIASRMASGEDAWCLKTDDALFSGVIGRGADGTVILQSEDCVQSFDVAETAGGIWIGRAGQRWLLTDDMPLTLKRSGPASTRSGAQTIVAPMPGIVAKVNVAEGDVVVPHQVLLVLEAMKMEHAIEAPGAARVRRLYYDAGALVSAGSVLIDLVQDG